MINSEIENLIKLIGSLPGLGPRSARRIVLHLLRNKEKLMNPLFKKISEVSELALNCEICGNLDTKDICYICDDKRRDNSIICVVENISDLWAIERSSSFKGIYHVLGGVLSAFENKGPKELKINNLIKRAQNEETKEILLANSATVDGQTTAHYIAEVLEEHDVIVSRLAYGLPMGGELDFLDDGTITQAINARSKL